MTWGTNFLRGFLNQSVLSSQNKPWPNTNRGRGLCKFIPNPYAMHFSCFWWKENVFLWRKSKPRCFRNAFEMFPWANPWRFSAVLHHFLFVLRSSTGKCLNPKLFNSLLVLFAFLQGFIFNYRNLWTSMFLLCLKYNEGDVLN